MASSKISELSAARADQVYPDDLLTFVDVSEPNVEFINKKITTGDFAAYLKDYTNLFPIPFNSRYILPAAYINGVETPIASKVAGQTVNLGDVKAFKFDEYGRVYDYSNSSNTQASEEVFMAAGTAASWFKTKITSDFNTAQPSNLTGNGVGTGDNNAGFFNANSYWNPKGIRGATYVNAQKINYSDRQENDYDWAHYFSKTYGRFKKSIIEMVQGNGYSTETYANSTIKIEIDWENARVTASGILASLGNYNSSFLMSANLTDGINNIQGTINSNVYVANPRLIIDYPNKQILGLPLCGIIINGLYRNSAQNISLVQTNLI